MATSSLTLVGMPSVLIQGRIVVAFGYLFFVGLIVFNFAKYPLPFVSAWQWACYVIAIHLPLAGLAFFACSSAAFPVSWLWGGIGVCFSARALQFGVGLVFICTPLRAYFSESFWARDWTSKSSVGQKRLPPFSIMLVGMLALWFYTF